MKPRPIELLSPAKNLECGIAAIDHGADAVYIGAPRFGARAAAGNSLEDLKTLTDYAHLFGVRIYVTLNTILFDNELAEAEQMAWELYRIGVDALIVQDLALLRLDLPPIALHASTQMDNRSAEKVRWLKEQGYRQTVLARELSLNDIQSIHEEVPEMQLEVFVHGALCVSYSGQCFASQYCFRRSANRGECAQFCRLPFSMIDDEGHVWAKNRHLLSLKDMNRSASLEKLMDAGVSSFKIEGRLKDVSYVKNVTAFYRQQLDAILCRRKEYIRPSEGDSTFTFTPNPSKSFNRGFTEYFLHGRTDDIYSFASPKSVGEPMGEVKSVLRDSIVVDTPLFHNGDGICFIDDKGELQGCRVNRAEGERLFIEPSFIQENRMGLRHAFLFRNYDIEFERTLGKPSATRRIPADITLREVSFGYSLTFNDTTLVFPCEKEEARTPQADNIKTQLSKLGDTIFKARNVEVLLSGNRFIPSSTLSSWRRQVVEASLRTKRITRPLELTKRKGEEIVPSTIGGTPFPSLTYLGNVANHTSANVFRQMGYRHIEPAFELKQPPKGTLMFCKHCLRYAFGLCPKQHPKHTPQNLTLVSNDGKRFPLRFDCKQCIMQVDFDDSHA
ncbi:MAG: U32 family peptidase [Bacteroidaceae bacterium]|nr:U32 family peptidase [Bacteroidaceae bacterium]